MSAINRREPGAAFSVLSILSGATTKAQSASAEEVSAEPRLLQSAVFSLDRAPESRLPNGGKSWNMFHGVLATGETVALHESMQPAGLAPNPPHTIRHSELILVRQGTLLFEHDGKLEKAGPGGVLFVAFGTKHTARNVGDGPAEYCVLAIGGDTK